MMTDDGDAMIPWGLACFSGYMGLEKCMSHDLGRDW